MFMDSHGFEILFNSKWAKFVGGLINLGFTNFHPFKEIFSRWFLVKLTLKN